MSMGDQRRTIAVGAPPEPHAGSHLLRDQMTAERVVHVWPSNFDVPLCGVRVTLRTLWDNRLADGGVRRMRQILAEHREYSGKARWCSRCLSALKSSK